MKMKLQLFLVCFIFSLGLLLGCSGAEDRIAAHFERGRTLYEEKDFTKAMLEFRNVIQIDPSHIQARMFVARINEQTQRWREAIGNYRRVLEIDPAFVEAHVRLGQLYVLGGAIEQARTHADEAILKSPTDPAALTLLGSIKAQEGDIDGALDRGLEALKVEPGHANATSLVSSLYVREKKFDEAVTVLNDGITKNPSNLGLRTLLARIYAVQGEFEAAGVLFREIVRGEPDNLTYRVQLSAFLASRGQMTEAVQVFLDGIDLDKSNATILAMVEFLVEQGLKQQAVERLQYYISQRPSEMELRFGLARLHEESNEPHLAKEQYRLIIADKALAPAGLEARNRLANLLWREGDSKGALRTVLEVLKENKRDKEGLLLRANLSLEGGDEESAISDLRTVLRDHPNDVAVLRLLAEAYAASNAIDQARDAYQRAIDASGGDPMSHWAYAAFLLRMGESESARSHLETALASNPNHKQLLSTLVRVQLAAGDWVGSEKQIRRYREIHPDDPEGHLLSGLYLHARGDYEGSIVELEQADLSDPKGAQAMSALVKSHLALGHTDRAYAQLDASLASDPNHVVAWNLKGELLRMEGRFGPAEEAFRKAIAIRPTWGVPYRNLGSVLLEQGEDEMAANVFKEGLEATDSAPSLVFELANRYEKLGNTSLAIEQYEKLLIENPQLHAAANNLALLLVTNYQDSQSLQRAKTLTERFRHSTNPAFLDTLGWVHYKLGDVDAARSILEEVVRLSPDVPEYQYHLGMVYHSRGDAMRAGEHLKKAIAAGEQFRGVQNAKSTLEEIEGG